MVAFFDLDCKCDFLVLMQIGETGDQTSNGL